MKMIVCKICCSSLDSKKGDRKSLHGTATDTSDVYTAVIGLFCEVRPNGAVMEFHRYLAEPAFVCKSCFNTVRRYLETKEKLTSRLDAAYSTFAAEVCHTGARVLLVQYTCFLKSRQSWACLRVKI